MCDICHLDTRNLYGKIQIGEERFMTYVNTADITAQMFVTVLLFLLVIAPLFSLAILRLFQGKKKAGLTLIGAGIGAYAIFQLIMVIFF